MDDYISRQEAIRIVDSIDTWQAGWRGDAIESMKALPPAQPELANYSPTLANENGDLISRQAVKKILSDEFDGWPSETDIAQWERLNRQVNELPSAQPSQVARDIATIIENEKDMRVVLKNVERKKGKWIPVDSYSACGGDEVTWMVHGNPIAFYYCSECKEQAYADENGESILSKFCPNCGADMKGEQDG